MGILKSATATNQLQVTNNHDYVGAPSFRFQNPAYGFLDCYEADKYASVYPSVKAITNEFMKIRPYSINGNGKPVKSRAVDALYHPNIADSSVAFFEKLAVMNLTHRKTYLLVWRREGSEAKPGGQITPNNIAGFTFLERPAVSRRDGKTFYKIGAQEFSENEVIVIPGGVDPNNLYLGYAPGEASRRWATLDQYIADYQTGFFENGAVPSGQFIITASSKQDYEDTVDAMQKKHRGAGKNNNVTYTPRPTDPKTGKPGDSKIEWIPFASTNKDIDFKNLFEQANNRIDSAYGVPASIRGVGENNNYATAQTDRQNFMLLAVDPLALRIYTQITHELNRITNGLGVSITYEIEIPVISDEEKVKAETKQVEVTTINLLLAQGYTLDSIVDALELSNGYKLLKEGATNNTQIDNDKPDVDEGGEVNGSPDPEKIDGVSPLNKGAAKAKSPKAKEKTDEDYEADLAAVARQYMQRQIDKAVADFDLEQESANNEVTGDPTDEQQEQFVQEMLAIIVTILLVKGALQYATGKDLVSGSGVDVGDLHEYIVSDTLRDSYEAYLARVGDSYGADTKESIQKVLSNARDNGLNERDTRKALKNIVDTDEWRVKRLSTTELNRSQALGGVDSMVQIQTETGVELQKALTHTGSDSPCEFCAALIGKWESVDQPLVQLDESIVGIDGGIMINDFVQNDGYDPHPNGHCLLEYRVAK